MVSIIIPVYNVEAYLEECLNSVIAQTYTDLQIIVIDDGSTDRSGLICDRFAAKDVRIQLVHQENQGLSAARNRGLDLASGEYVSFVDSDDYLLPECIETLLKLCCEHNADMAVCSYSMLKKGKITQLKSRHHAASEPELNTGPGKMDAYLRKKTIGVTSWGKLYAAGLFHEIHFPDGKLYEDCYTTYQLIHAAKRIAVTQAPLYIYRIRPQSITNSPYSDKKLDQLTARLEVSSFIRQYYPDLLPYAQANVITACNSLLISLALSKMRSREAESQFRRLYRKHIFLYLVYGHSFKSKAFAVLASINTSMAKLFAYWYIKWKA